MSGKPTSYIVLFDNDDLVYPMGWDPDYAGALCCRNTRSPVAVFADRKSARQAIRVSTAFAKLRQAAGQPANDDFLQNVSKQVHIVPLQPKPFA